MDLKFSMKPYLPSLITCVIIFIFVFLPWATASAQGITISFNGLEVNISGLGYLTLIMSIIGAGVSFISTPRARSLSIIITGILAIVGTAVYWSQLQGLTAGYGLIIALIGSLALIAFGYAEYRKLTQTEKPEPPPQSPPTPPEPPQS